MTLLFLTAVCDWCDGTGEYPLWSGYVVWRGARSRESSYVFKTLEDAEKWRSANDLDTMPIVEVLSEEPFVWRESTGSLRDLELADRLYKIHPDRFFRRAEGHAFIADRTPAAAETAP